jgi:2,5-furandicarboxylate decarboxylase 1
VRIPGQDTVDLDRLVATSNAAFEAYLHSGQLRDAV